MTPHDLHWRISSFSGTQFNCVELAIHPTDGVLVRNSNHRDAGALTIDAPVMAQLIAASKAGTLDHLA